jgi:hypothetical protein
MGATSLAHDLARQFALPLVPPRPGLVPLTFEGEALSLMRPLSGLATQVVATAGKRSFAEAMLFTHRGLSGPAILQASSYWRKGESIVIDWLPDAHEDALAARKRERPKAQLKTVLADFMSERLADTLLQSWTGGVSPAVQEMGAFKDAVLLDLTRALKSFTLTPNGDEGYAKAEVMVGGIDTNALSQQSMETRAVPGLFFIGEAVDVTGWLGGYNFQWAWSSGWAAGQAI